MALPTDINRPLPGDCLGCDCSRDLGVVATKNLARPGACFLVRSGFDYRHDAVSWFAPISISLHANDVVVCRSWRAGDLASREGAP